MIDGLKRFEVLNGLPVQVKIHFVNFHTFTDSFKQHDGKFTAQVLAELIQVRWSRESGWEGSSSRWFPARAPKAGTRSFSVYREFEYRSASVIIPFSME
jgi:hypothetical protein